LVSILLAFLLVGQDVARARGLDPQVVRAFDALTFIDATQTRRYAHRRREMPVARQLQNHRSDEMADRWGIG
jgi:hypothetical protein